MVNWDLLDNHWDSLAGWIIHPANPDSGIAEINPASQLHILWQSGGSKSYKRVYKNIGQIPDELTQEFNVSINAFGFHERRNYLGVLYVGFRVYNDHITIRKNDDTDESYDIATNIDTWYIWRLLIDQTAHTVAVYRNTQFIRKFTDVKQYVPAEGQLEIWAAEGGTGQAELHEEYFRIATGLHAPATKTILNLGTIGIALEDFTLSKGDVVTLIP